MVASRTPVARRRARAVLLAGFLAVLALAQPTPAAAASPFAWRGVVEAPYGRVWDHNERTRALAWMGSHGFNAYIHAPKDDPYQRANWRDAYPAAQQAEFNSEVSYGLARGVQWIPSISPGYSLYGTKTNGTGGDAPACLSCTADLNTLIAKFRPFLVAGSRTFMVSFDDDHIQFTHPEDAAHYGVANLSPADPRYQVAYGRATGDFLSRTAAALRAATGGQAKLLTVLIDYSGTHDSPYLQGVRASLDPAVGVLWTGPAVQHQEFSASDANAYGSLIRRTPIVWDNWSNTDGCCTLPGLGEHTMAFLGPYRRSPSVVGSVQGFFLDPMNEADLNKLPLATAGEWLANPSGYDADAAWSRALGELAGGDAARTDALRAWAETYHWTKSDIARGRAANDRYLGVAPTFSIRRNAFLAAYGAGGGWPASGDALLRELDLVAHAPQTLASLPDASLAASAAPFARASARAAVAGALAQELLAAERPSVSLAPAAGPGAGWTGRAVAPNVSEIARLRGLEGARAAQERVQVPCAYGFHGATNVNANGPFYVCDPGRKPYFDDFFTPNNAMDLLLDQAGQVDAGWQSRGGTAASSLRVTVDGQPVAVAADGSFAVDAAACGKSLEVTDGAGGRRAITLPACTGVADTTPPATAVTAAPLAPWNSSDAAVSFSSSEEGSSFSCSVDGAPAQTCRSPLVLGGLREGGHSVVVTATDPAGNADSSPAVALWSEDLTPPGTSISSGPSGLVASKTATFNFNASEAGSSFGCSLDGGPYVSCAGTKTYTSLAEGPHTFVVRATDPAGNVDATPAGASWTVDSKAPSVTITSGPRGRLRSSTAQFRFRASESGSVYSCSLDGGPFRECSSPRTYRKLDWDTHAFRVRARDRARNLDPTPTRRGWTVTPPIGVGVRVAPQSLSTVLRRGLSVQVGCLVRCRVTVTAAPALGYARALKLASRGKPLAVASGQTMAGWTGRYVRLKLSARARRALARARRIGLVLSVVARNGDGVPARLKHATTLRR